MSKSAFRTVCVGVFLVGRVFAVLSLCVLWEKASVGCSFISGASSCMKCSSEGTVCPVAFAGTAWALATQTCGLNSHEHTHTHVNINTYTHAVSKALAQIQDTSAPH